MHDQLQHVLAFAQAQESGPEQRRPTEIERLPGSSVEQAIELLLAGVGGGPADLDNRQIDRSRGEDPLHRHAIAHLECGAQALVAPDHLPQAALQSRHVQRSAQTHRVTHVVQAAGTQQVVEEPQRLLRMGRGGIAPARTPRDARAGTHPLPPLLQPQRQKPLPLGRQGTGRATAPARLIVLAVHCSRGGGAPPPHRTVLGSRPTEPLPPLGGAPRIVRCSSPSRRCSGVGTS